VFAFHLLERRKDRGRILFVVLRTTISCLGVVLYLQHGTLLTAALSEPNQPDHRGRGVRNYFNYIMVKCQMFKGA
jgi:hypothetical protein